MSNCNLTAQAMALDLFSHQMAGFDGEKVRAAPQISQGSLFGIPEGWEPVAIMTIGYLDDPHTLPESLREQELILRTCKPLPEFIFTGKWNQTSGLVTD